MSGTGLPPHRLRPMLVGDLPQILAIEREVYSHPWTAGNFRDSLNAGYSCWVMDDGRHVIAYAVLMIGVGEAHLLNLSVAKPVQKRGQGRLLLAHLLGIARAAALEQVLLEVRPSNHAARQLYARAGFREVHVRRGYYPAAGGREDAILMALPLTTSREVE